jgi:ketosteroid isomerase-like protein
MSTPENVATTYFDAWKTKDFDRLDAILAEDATFRGPLGTADGAAQLRSGLERLAEITTDIVVVKRWVDGPDVLTWFELHTSVAEPVPVANWTRVEDGRITRVRVTFDPRSLAP